ncbi:MAG: SET domain-containing protein [Desulfopila sp.]|jgi:hypothetical protein|nr:SET domain-containing protein [Desulfopila sp.]
MIHPSTQVQYINTEKGYGLVATEKIPHGTIIWTLDPLDRTISPSQMQEFEPQFRDILLTYSFRNNQGNYVFCWDNGKYINHSFQANCCLTPYSFEIAVRDIEKGEELTDDYGYLNIIEPFEADAEGSNRSVVYPDDLLRYADIWDEKVKAAFPELLRRKQPLWPFVSQDIKERIKAVLAGKDQLLSLRSCYYGGMG